MGYIVVRAVHRGEIPVIELLAYTTVIRDYGQEIREQPDASFPIPFPLIPISYSTVCTSPTPDEEALDAG